jgi:hypothetical protein
MRWAVPRASTEGREKGKDVSSSSCVGEWLITTTDESKDGKRGRKSENVRSTMSRTLTPTVSPQALNASLLFADGFTPFASISLHASSETTALIDGTDLTSLSSSGM